MATAYTEFDCLGTALLSTIQTAILASSDWARPNSGTFPTLYKATTTAGAQMCIDINTTAITTTNLIYTWYRTHDGTTGVDPLNKGFRFKRNASGTLATNSYHGRVSAGKDHLYIDIEGPRPGETNTDHNGYGSLRNYLFISALEPYYDTVDTTPTVIVGGGQAINSSSALGNGSQYAYASRNGRNTLSWSAGILTTLTHPIAYGSELFNVNRIPLLDPDHKFTVGPYVFFDTSEGMRGRLMRFHFAGFVYYTQQADGPSAPVGAVLNVGGVNYKVLQVNKSDATGNENCWGPFGLANNNGISYASPAVVVPCV